MTPRPSSCVLRKWKLRRSEVMNLMTKMRAAPPPASDRVTAIIGSVQKSTELLEAEQILAAARDRRAELVRDRGETHARISRSLDNYAEGERKMKQLSKAIEETETVIVAARTERNKL